jgi:hypothetical protein
LIYDSDVKRTKLEVHAEGAAERTKFAQHNPAPHQHSPPQPLRLGFVVDRLAGCDQDLLARKHDWKSQRSAERLAILHMDRGLGWITRAAVAGCFGYCSSIRARPVF